jgi:hypothetical protein
MADLTPADIVPVQTQQPQADSGGDMGAQEILTAVDGILTKGLQFVDKVAMARGMQPTGGQQASGASTGGGIGLPEIQQALKVVQQAKGDITISELLGLMEENAEAVESALKGL